MFPSVGERIGGAGHRQVHGATTARAALGGEDVPALTQLRMVTADLAVGLALGSHLLDASRLLSWAQIAHVGSSPPVRGLGR